LKVSKNGYQVQVETISGTAYINILLQGRHSTITSPPVRLHFSLRSAQTNGA
jgi:hypothetical protein